MSNTYFQFKQFTVQQEHCAMKVCTDACLFGAWVANWLQNKEDQPNQILDIGTGTGLLSLMLAQITNANLDAVEIDEAAAKQAKENFKLSRWSNQLTVFHSDIQFFFTPKKYDLIISNPPFYEQDLKSNNNTRNIALHSQALTLAELLQLVLKQITASGYFAILLPYFRASEFIAMAKKCGFLVAKEARIQQTESHDFFRTMLIFSCQAEKAITETIIIKKNHTYSNTFRNLLSSYYLPF